jgi:hypothetical protein
MAAYFTTGSSRSTRVWPSWRWPLASLDGEPEADVEAAWASEIERRAREALANPDDDVAWETVRAELRAAPMR